MSRGDDGRNCDRCASKSANSFFLLLENSPFIFVPPHSVIYNCGTLEEARPADKYSNLDIISRRVQHARTDMSVSSAASGALFNGLQPIQYDKKTEN